MSGLTPSPHPPAIAEAAHAATRGGFRGDTDGDRCDRRRLQPTTQGRRARIFAAKGRPTFNPLIVHVPDLAAAAEIVTFVPEARLLAETFWPTLTFDRRANPAHASRCWWYRA